MLRVDYQKTKKIAFIFVFFALAMVVGIFLNFQTNNSNSFRSKKDNENDISNDISEEIFSYNLRSSDYSSSIKENGGDINISLYQALYDTSLKSIVNTSDPNNNTFTVPSPTDANFNSTYTYIEIEDIVSHNKTIVIEETNPNNATDGFSQGKVKATSFIVGQDTYLMNISVYITSSKNKFFSFKVVLFNTTWVGGQSQPNGGETDFHAVLGEFNGTAPKFDPYNNWYHCNNLNYYLNNSNTDNNTWCIGLAEADDSSSPGNPEWYYVLDSVNGNNSDSYTISGNVWTMISPSVDFMTKMTFNKASKFPIASLAEVGLKINGTPVIGTGGNGTWNSTEPFGGSSGQLKFNITADWDSLEFNITLVQINYTKTNLATTPSFSISGSGQDVVWNVSRADGLKLFDKRLNNYEINFTIPDSWNNVNVFNGTINKTSFISSHLLNNGYKNIRVKNAGNGTTWMLNATSMNLLQSIDTYLGSNPQNIFSNTDTIHFNVTFSEIIAQNNGIINLSVYSPITINDKLNFSSTKSTFDSNSEISLVDWNILDNATQCGKFRVLLNWYNNTAAGFKEKIVTILGNSQLIIANPPDNSEYANVAIFNISTYFNDTVFNTGIIGAQFEVDINGTDYYPSVLDKGNGYYDLEINCSDSAINVGSNAIRINGSTPYYNNQSQILYIKVIVDIDNPSIVNIIDDGPAEWNTGTLTVNSNVTDNCELSGIDPVQVQIWDSSNTLLLDWASTSTFGGTGYRYIWSVGANPIGTGYYYRIRANDTSNNIVITSNYTFNIVDTVDPSTANIADDGPTEWSIESLTVTLNVTDNNALSGTDPVQIQIWKPTDSRLLDWTSMSTFGGGTGFRHIWSVGANPIGTGYYYRIRSNDTSNNIVITSNYTFNIVDTVDPVIVNVVDNGPIDWGTGSLTVTGNVTDNSALSGSDPVQIQIWNPSNTFLLDWIYVKK